jgi:hypothetical protein
MPDNKNVFEKLFKDVQRKINYEYNKVKNINKKIEQHRSVLKQISQSMTLFDVVELQDDRRKLEVLNTPPCRGSRKGFESSTTKEYEERLRARYVLLRTLKAPDVAILLTREPNWHGGIPSIKIDFLILGHYAIGKFEVPCTCCNLEEEHEYAVNLFKFCSEKGISTLLLRKANDWEHLIPKGIEIKLEEAKNLFDTQRNNHRKIDEAFIGFIETKSAWGCNMTYVPEMNYSYKKVLEVHKY